MKKITVLIISFMFLLTSSLQASPFSPKNIYSFISEAARPPSELLPFRPPKDMLFRSILGSPVQSTKQDGTKGFISGNGKLSVSKNQNGETMVTVGGVSKKYDKLGNLVSISRTLSGNLQEIRNEFNDVTGYNKLDGNGKVIASFDEDMNQTTTYNYDIYGKHMESSVNLMTGQRTVYDKFERAVAVYSWDGYIVKTFQYKDVSYDTTDRMTLTITQNEGSFESGGIVSTKDYYNSLIRSDNKNVEYDIMAYDMTSFDDDGLTLQVDRFEGTKPPVTIQSYVYKRDGFGNRVIDYVLNTETKEKTYYENNRQSYVKNDAGSIIKRYYWRGSEFLLSAEISNGIVNSTTDKDGKTVTSNIIFNEEKQTYGEVSADGTITSYHYTMENGVKLLDYIEHSDGTKTFYKEGENGARIAEKTVAPDGTILTDYGWDKNNLVYTYDATTGVTKWFAGDSENPLVIFESIEDRMKSENIRVNGELYASWECVQGETVKKDENGNAVLDSAGNSVLEKVNTYSLTIYVNESQMFKINYLKEKPNAALAAYIRNEYIKTGSYSEQWLLDKGYIDERMAGEDDVLDTSVANNSQNGNSNNP